MKYRLKKAAWMRAMILNLLCVLTSGLCGPAASFAAPVQAVRPVQSVRSAPPVASVWAEGVTAQASSAQVADGLTAPANTVNAHGLAETPAGSGVYVLTNDTNADGGSFWNSSYLPNVGGDENALIQWDLGRTLTLDRVHVWNYNGTNNTGRGFRNVTISASADKRRWRTLPQRFMFGQATGKPGYTGEDVVFTTTITTRYIRFQADSTWRTGGNRELAGLGKVRFHVVADAAQATTPKANPKVAPEVNRTLDRRISKVFPADAGVIDVTQPPYNARADGKTDDTDALQRTIHDWQGTRQTIYLPNGVYLVSHSLRYRTGVGYGFTNLRGQSRDKTIVRLRDGAFTDPAHPIAVLFTGYNGAEGSGRVSADWFNNNVRDLTIDTGRNNPGAIALQFYSNNVGSARNLTLRAGDGQGAIGLDLAYADQNGPHLIQNVLVDGFGVGVKTGATVNSQTLEHITIRNARTVGLQNDGQCVSIRDLNITGDTPSVRNNSGVMCLVQATLRGGPHTRTLSAITNGEALFARDIVTSGFGAAIANKDARVMGAIGPRVGEWTSRPPLSLFGGTEHSLRLPIKATPLAPIDPPALWANVRDFRDIKDPDDSRAVQRAIDSGAQTIYFPSQGSYFLSETSIVRGRARRFVGMFSDIRITARPAFKIVEGSVREGAGSTLWFEDFRTDENPRCIPLENASHRALVVQNAQGLGGVTTGGGDLFLDNVVADWEFGHQNVWARQLNNERQGTHLQNTGGALWILGLKTERGGTLIETRDNGKTEVLGGLSYTTTAGTLAPMFVVSDSLFSATLGEVCYSGDPYAVVVRETRQSKTRQMARRGRAVADAYADTRLDFLNGSLLTLYSNSP